MKLIRAIFCCLVGATPVTALELDLPSNARETATQNTTIDVYVAPVGVFADGALPSVQVKGEVRRSAFRMASAGLTPLQVIEPLRAQLEASGHQIVLDCAADRCGGFDFRFATETLPAPAMHISLREYHFVTAVIGDATAPDRVVTLLASTSTASAHLQIIQAGRLDGTPDQFTRGADVPETGEVATTQTRPNLRPKTDTPPPQSLPLVQGLPTERRVLRELEFGTGSGDLGEGPFEVLKEVAATLAANPDLNLALVGHTDNTGPLEVNITISRRRAEAVRQRLIEKHGIAANRLSAHGVGFLSPLASNESDDGRTINRRVEAVFLPGG